MSAIWGIIEKNNTDIHEIFLKMTQAMERYKLDRIDTVGDSGNFFACGHQYFTQEAVNDISPIFDEELGIYFAADCFLYNREAVIALLDENIDEASTGDAYLAFLLYKKLGESFVEYLRGSFSFAILENKNKRLHLYTDHFCKRYLAYYKTDEFIAFASCYKPLLEAADHKLTISKRSIVNAYSNMAPLFFREKEITVYEEIKHLDASMHYCFDLQTGDVAKVQYWTPRESVKKLKGLKDEDYKELFLNEYRKVSVAHLRSRKETGIMLSGGLDSASVLAMVAPVLREENKTIFSYTTVPSKDFDAKINFNVIEDETFLIKEQQKLQPNLEPRYIGGDEDTCLDNVAAYSSLFDNPIKAVVNTDNVVKMNKAAAADDCLILLGGGNGNPTVSYGYVTNYVGLCMSRGKFISAVRELNIYCKLCNFSRKQMLKDWMKDVYNYLFTIQNLGQYFINEQDRKEYGISNIMREDKKNLGSAFVTNERQKRNFMYMPTQYIQKSFYYTLLSLEYGVLQLDPTLSVEMVELAMSLPDECFVKNGVERRLIRDYMKELLPTWITDMRKGYGVQASDFNYRINRDWDKIKDEVYDLFNEPALYDFLDKDEVEEVLNDVKNNEYKLGWNTAWFMANICALSIFLRGHRKYLK